MKRLLFVALMMTCSVSWAEWDFCGKTSNGEGDDNLYYCDKSTIRKNGVISRMWEMIDYSKVQTNSSGKNYRSIKILRAFNCREETVAIISFVMHSGTMGAGSAVFSFTLQEKEWEWEPIVPNTIGATMWKTACGK
jgi:hypothetical protein